MGKIKSIALKTMKYFLQKEEERNRSAVFDKLSFVSIKNVPPEKAGSILFVIPPMDFGSGGLTSILRIARACSERGIEVFFHDYRDGNVAQEEAIAEKNLFGYHAKFLSEQDLKGRKFDFVCATSWETVYFANKIEGYHLYFVQDYEPAFYAFGDNYFLSKNTYQLGYHIISLGGWNVKMIRAGATGAIKADQIDFPYDPSEYQQVKKDFAAYKSKKEIHLAIYIKMEEKRAPYLILSMIEQTAKKLLDADGVTLVPHYFGLNKKYKIDKGENLGRLGKKELLDLYHRCDFGLVASLTNVSLVPLEMMGSGLPVIEFADGSFPYFFGNDAAILTSFDPDDLYEKIHNTLANPDALARMMDVAEKKLAPLSWKKTTEQFVEILLSCVKKSASTSV